MSQAHQDTSPCWLGAARCHTNATKHSSFPKELEKTNHTIFWQPKSHKYADKHNILTTEEKSVNKSLCPVGNIVKRKDCCNKWKQNRFCFPQNQRTSSRDVKMIKFFFFFFCASWKVWKSSKCQNGLRFEYFFGNFCDVQKKRSVVHSVWSKLSLDFVISCFCVCHAYAQQAEKSTVDFVPVCELITYASGIKIPNPCVVW